MDSLELRVRLACGALKAAGLAIVLRRSAPQEEFAGLPRWMCAVMLDKCVGPSFSAKRKPKVVTTGTATVSVSVRLDPITGEMGEPGRCRQLRCWRIPIVCQPKRRIQQNYSSISHEPVDNIS